MSSIYVMAHRCNTVEWLDHAIQWQANAIEVDIIKDDGRFYCWHGEGGWEHLSTYLDHACNAFQTGNGQNIAMMIFDLKYKRKDKIRARDINTIRNEVATRLLEPINRGRSERALGGLYAFYGVYKGGRYAGEFETAMSTRGLSGHEGINYDADRKIEPQEALDWKNDNDVANFFYSSGIMASLPSGAMWRQLSAAQELRATNEFGVYGWTFNKAGSTADIIKGYKLDGVLGNMNQKFGWLPTYLDHYGLEDYRLVTRDEVPPFRTLQG